MSSISLYRKWRPQTFAALKGQDVIRDTLVYALNNNQMSQAYLFCGPRGTGKTTTARLIAKLLNCTAPDGAKPCNACPSCRTITEGANLDVLELDAASNRGIDEIRQLRETVRFAPTQATYKVFIIDEVHMLTREAFNALLKTLEEPPKYVVFILATTEAHKIPPTIISRTQRYDFRPAPLETLAAHLQEVAAAEQMKLTPDAALFVARLGEGSFRDALSLLEQVNAADYPEYTLEVIEKLLGYIPREQVEMALQATLNGQAKEAHNFIDAALAQGADLRAFGDQLLHMSQEVLEAVILGDPGLLGAGVMAGAKQLGLSRLVAWVEALGGALQQMKQCPIPRLPLDVAIAKFAGMPKVEVVSRSVIASEQGERGNLEHKIATSPSASRDDKAIGVLPVALAPGKTAEPTAPLVETVSVPVMAEVPEHISKDDWLKMLSHIKQEAPSLLTSLAHARVLKVEHDVITLAVEYKMHAEKLNQPKHRATVEAALNEVLGVPMKLSTEVVKDLPKIVSDDDIVDVADVFELET